MKLLAILSEKIDNLSNYSKQSFRFCNYIMIGFYLCGGLALATADGAFDYFGNLNFAKNAVHAGNACILVALIVMTLIELYIKEKSQKS